MSTRPWQHVLEPLSGYLQLGFELCKTSKLHGQAFNFGPNPQNNHSVGKLVSLLGEEWGGKTWQDISSQKDLIIESKLLKLNCDKALYHLQWKPSLSFEETVEKTSSWYYEYYNNKNKSIYELTYNQISYYASKAVKNDLKWAK